MRGLSRKLLVVLLILLMLFVAPTPVFASWLSWLGVGCTVAAVVATFFPPKGTVAAGVLAVAQLVLFFTDAALTLARSGPIPQPDFAGLPEPDAFNGAPLPYIQFEHLPLSGDDTDDLVNAANDMIDAFNVFWTDLASGAGPDQINQDLADLSSQMELVANAYDALGLDVEVTQGDLNEILASIQTDGLPDIEVQMLRGAGAGDDFIQALGNWVGRTGLQLRASSVSAAELLHTAAAYLPLAGGG